MSPNGRRAWRRWMRRQDLRRKHKQPKGSVCRMARQARRHIPLVPGVVLPKFITARSLVGMSQSSRKRKARAVAFVVINSVTFFEHAVPLASALHERLYRERGFPRHSEEMRLVRDVRAKYRIGECLRPCPGCCACWGHRISSAYGEIAECCGPQTSGKRKSQIKAMRKWQETLADNCDGSGVLPARRS